MTFTNDKHFLIVYQEGRDTKTVSVGFRNMNFLHMTGVKTQLSVQQFYEACLDSKLSENDFEIDNKGKVQQKLMALPVSCRVTISSLYDWKFHQ